MDWLICLSPGLLITSVSAYLVVAMGPRDTMGEEISITYIGLTAFTVTSKNTCY